jgi:hypothetical protein
MQTAPEIPRPSATANNWFPAKVTLLLSKQSGFKSSYLKEGRTLPYEPSTVPERHPLPMRNGPGGTRTLTRTLARNCAAITPQAHEPKLTSVTVRLRASIPHLLRQSFVLEQAWRPTSHILCEKWAMPPLRPGTGIATNPENLSNPVTSYLAIHSPNSRSWSRK